MTIGGELYRFGQQLGKGSFGDVYMVQHNNKYYAVKKLFLGNLHAKDCENAMLEIINVNLVKHENIIKIEDWKLQDSNLYIFMEYADGGDLDSYIKNLDDDHS